MFVDIASLSLDEGPGGPAAPRKRMAGRKPKKASIRIDPAGQFYAPEASLDRDVPTKKTFKGRMMGLQEIHERRADRFEHLPIEHLPSDRFEHLPMEHKPIFEQEPTGLEFIHEENTQKPQKRWKLPNLKSYFASRKRSRKLHRVQKQVVKAHRKELGKMNKKGATMPDEEFPDSMRSFSTVGTAITSPNSSCSSFPKSCLKSTGGSESSEEVPVARVSFAPSTIAPSEDDAFPKSAPGKKTRVSSNHKNDWAPKYPHRKESPRTSPADSRSDSSSPRDVPPPCPKEAPTTESPTASLVDDESCSDSIVSVEEILEFVANTQPSTTTNVRSEVKKIFQLVKENSLSRIDTYHSRIDAYTAETPNEKQRKKKEKKEKKAKRKRDKKAKKQQKQQIDTSSSSESNPGAAVQNPSPPETHNKFREEIQRGYQQQSLTTQNLQERLETLRRKRYEELTGGLCPPMLPSIDDDMPHYPPRNNSPSQYGPTVSFHPIATVINSLSRHDMPPDEKFHYWFNKEEDDFMTDTVLEMMTNRWKKRRAQEDAQYELEFGNAIDDQGEGDLGYTYTIEIQA